MKNRYRSFLAILCVCTHVCAYVHIDMYEYKYAGTMPEYGDHSLTSGVCSPLTSTLTESPRSFLLRRSGWIT